MKELFKRALRVLKKVVSAGAIVFAVFVFAAGMLVLAKYKDMSVSFPRTQIGATQLGELSAEEVNEKLTKVAQDFAQTGFLFNWQGEMEDFTPEELGFEIDIQRTQEQVDFIGARGNLSFFMRLIQKTFVKPVLTVDRIKFREVLDMHFPGVARARNASFIYDSENKLVVQSEQGGWNLKYEDLIMVLMDKWSSFSKGQIQINSVWKEPTVKRAEIEEKKDELIAKLSEELYLASGDEQWSLKPFDNIGFVFFEKNLEGEVAWYMDLLPLEQLIDNDISPVLEKIEQPVKIFYDEDNKVLIEGTGEDGTKINRESLITAADFALKNDIHSIEIPLIDIEAPLDIDIKLQELGIKELLAVGYSTFYRSPSNRVHNIGVGIDQYNGLLIPPGETFSFNDNLGRVDGSTGYKKELVIKHDGTIPEYGGGLCQVSTTMYRAVLNAGLPIVERSPHSYAVTYYSQVGGHGLDATIYPPAKDLKFLNDTPAHILIQSYRDGYEAYYKFYGTSDGREVELEGPYISNYKSAPTQEVIFYVKDLAPGERKQVQKPTTGFDATWYRIIRRGEGDDAEETRETLFSKYFAVPPKYQEGEVVTPEGENAGVMPEEAAAVAEDGAESPPQD